MDIISAIAPGIILGIVQGITEFLPVSSTGHLILARDILGFSSEYGLAFDAVLHLATAGAVMVYFWRDFLSLAYNAYRMVARKGVDPKTKTLLFGLILGTIPAVVLGLYLEESMETVFRSTTVVAWTLIAGSLLMLFAEYVHTRTRNTFATASLTVYKAVAIGFFQVLALIPGMSRSGATISGGLLLGISREDAARFAFLLSFPVILGAGLKKFVELETSGALASDASLIIAGAISAFVVGLAAIHFMITFLRSHTLIPFVVYRVALALGILFFTL